MEIPEVRTPLGACHAINSDCCGAVGPAHERSVAVGAETCAACVNGYCQPPLALSMSVSRYCSS